MFRSRFLVFLILAVSIPLTIAACGGDDDGGEDEEQITEVIETSVTSTDPADCSKLQTDQFLEQTSFETDGDALAECESEASDTSDDPDSVEVSEISVDGESATANVTFIGGPLDGSTASLALVKEGDQWKLDELTDIPEFNFEGFQQAFTEQLSSQEDVPPEFADCVVQTFADAGEERVKEVFLSGDGEQLNALIAPCIPSG